VCSQTRALLAPSASSVTSRHSQHQVSDNHVMLQVSVLVDAYGSRLPELLDTHQSLRLSVTEGAAVRQDKAQ
jgi:hypothetical protein